MQYHYRFTLFITLALFLSINGNATCDYSYSIFQNGHGQYCIPNRHQRPATNKIRNQNVHEASTLALIEQIYEPGTHVVHGGAYFGDMLPFFSKLVGNQKVWAFEPVKESHFCAQKTIELNELENIHLYNLALSSNTSQKTMMTKVGSTHLGGASKIVTAFNSKSNTYEVINTVRLDTLLQNIDGRIGLIHLDVEGHEIQALKGSQEIIKIHRPIIILEVYKENINKMNRYMSTLDYRFFTRTDQNNAYYPL